MRSPPAGAPAPLAGAAWLLLALAQPAPLHGQQVTPLLEDDLQQNRRTRIDGPSDDGLDAVFGGSGGGFSTRALEPIEDRLRAELRRERPRATPRLVLFLYPGKVSAQKLRAMSEINVDLELVLDPCDRSVCQDAVARHIEIVGRAIGKPAIVTPDYRIVWQALTLQTATQMRDARHQRQVVPIADLNTTRKGVTEHGQRADVVGLADDAQPAVGAGGGGELRPLEGQSGGTKRREGRGLSPDPPGVSEPGFGRDYLASSFLPFSFFSFFSTLSFFSPPLASSAEAMVKEAGTMKASASTSERVKVMAFSGSRGDSGSVVLQLAYRGTGCRAGAGLVERGGGACGGMARIRPRP